MAKILTSVDLSTINEPKEFMRHGSQAIQSIGDSVNGGLEFDKNMKTNTVVVVFASANTDVAVKHKLNKSSVHYLTGKKSVSCDIFTGTRAATTDTIYLQSTQPATVTLVLF